MIMIPIAILIFNFGIYTNTITMCSYLHSGDGLANCAIRKSPRAGSSAAGDVSLQRLHGIR